jgi:hypothetical protein
MDPTKHPDHAELRFPRLGAPTGRFPLGYSPVPECGTFGEPEELDERDYDRHIAKDREQRQRAQERGLELELLGKSQEERYEKVMLEARRLRRDIAQWSRVYMKLTAKGKHRQADKWLQRMEQVAYLGRVA